MDLRNFHNSFFVENYDLNLNFFKCCRVLSLKTKANILDASHLKIAWHSKRQKKSSEKRERKMKNEIKSNSSSNYFLAFTFLYRKIYISLMNDEFFFVVWLTNERRLALFPARTMVRDPHHCESPTRCEQDLNLRRTWVQAFLNEVM